MKSLLLEGALLQAFIRTDAVAAKKILDMDVLLNDYESDLDSLKAAVKNSSEIPGMLELLFKSEILKNKKYYMRYLSQAIGAGGTDIKPSASRILEHLLRKGILQPNYVFHKSINQTLLMLFANLGWSDGVITLVEHGALVNLRDTRGETALDFAREMGQDDTVELLKKLGEKEKLNH